MAITEPGTGSDSAEHRHDGGPRRRRVRPQRREDLRHLGRPVRRRRRLGHPRQEPGPGRDQELRGAQGHARHDRRAARAQARHQGLGHRDHPLRGLPCPGREPPRLRRGRQQDRLRRRDGDVRQHPAARRRDGHRLCPRVPRPGPRPAGARRRDDRLRPAGARAVGRRGQVPADGGRLGRCPAADAAGRLDGRQREAELARGVDGQGEGGPGRLRHHPVVRRAVRQRRVRRGRAAREVGPRLQDPRHLRGHPADPAADRGPPGARPDERRADTDRQR